MKKLFGWLIALALIGGFIYSYVTYNFLDKDDKDSTSKSQITEELKDELEDLNYSKDDIKTIREELNEEEIESLKENNDKEYLMDYINVKCFKLENLSRYINYEMNTSYDKETIVMYVNIGIDKPFYTDIEIVDNPNDILVLVNKYHSLPTGIGAQDLVTFQENYNPRGALISSVAYDAFKNMFDDAANNGYELYMVSGHRTENYQSDLYSYYVRNEGVESADRTSARPNHSEHQTGLAADIGVTAWRIDGFENESVYPWVKENAHKYGLIERYPEGKEYLTGYDYEPWHYRYVGVEVATKIYEENITFEEYYVKYIDNN